MSSECETAAKSQNAEKCIQSVVALKGNEFLSSLPKITPLKPPAFWKFFHCTLTSYSSEKFCKCYRLAQTMDIALPNLPGTLIILFLHVEIHTGGSNCNGNTPYARHWTILITTVFKLCDESPQSSTKSTGNQSLSRKLVDQSKPA